jgi:hypothetical protein
MDTPVEGCPNSDKAVKQCVNFPTILNWVDQRKDYEK